jgi:hypothetical protein
MWRGSSKCLFEIFLTYSWFLTLATLLGTLDEFDTLISFFELVWLINRALAKGMASLLLIKSTCTPTTSAAPTFSPFFFFYVLFRVESRVFNLTVCEKFGLDMKLRDPALIPRRRLLLVVSLLSSFRDWSRMTSFFFTEFGFLLWGLFYLFMLAEHGFTALICSQSLVRDSYFLISYILVNLRSLSMDFNFKFKFMLLVSPWFSALSSIALEVIGGFSILRSRVTTPNPFPFEISYLFS